MVSNNAGQSSQGLVIRLFQGSLFHLPWLWGLGFRVGVLRCWVRAFCFSFLMTPRSDSSTTRRMTNKFTTAESCKKSSGGAEYGERRHGTGRGVSQLREASVVLLVIEWKRGFQQFKAVFPSPKPSARNSTLPETKWKPKEDPKKITVPLRVIWVSMLVWGSVVLYS